MTSAEAIEERLLVLAPTGRDAEVICELLSLNRIGCERVDSVRELAVEASAGAGAAFVADEALTPENLDLLARALEGQEPWSDLPVVVATSEMGARAAHERMRRRIARASSITILERPIPTTTLLTAIRAALSARRRQYQRRELLAQLRDNIRDLETEREVRGRFVAILAHDLRGPLQAVNLTVDLLARESVSPDQRSRLAQRVTRSLGQMDRMIRDLLDIHRIQAGGGLPLQLDRCELGGLVRDVADDLGKTYGDRFVVRVEERIEGIWSADQLRRSLWNLGTNAIKYGASDTPISLEAGCSEDDAVFLTVHNDGPAIPPEEQMTLFDAFGRTRSAKSGGERGWGLGLALVRSCAEAHGGSADVESHPGEGTTFIIRLPRDARPFQAPDAAPKGSSPHGTNGGQRAARGSAL